MDDTIAAEEFHESYAVVKVDGKGHTYIGTNGNAAVDAWWDYAGRFAKGHALVMNYMTDSDGNTFRRWSIINTDFAVVETLEDDVYIDAADEHSTDFSNGYIRTVDRATNLMGFIQLSETNSGAIEESCRIYGSITSYGSSADLITVQIYDEQGDIVTETTVSDAYTLEVSSGEYSLIVRKNGHFTATYPVTVNDTDVCQNVTLMLIGDVNNNHALDSNDINMLQQYFAGSLIPIATAVADADEDGVLSRRDIMILARHLAGWEGYTLPYKD